MGNRNMRLQATMAPNGGYDLTLGYIYDDTVRDMIKKQFDDLDPTIKAFLHEQALNLGFDERNAILPLWDVEIEIRRQIRDSLYDDRLKQAILKFAEGRGITEVQFPENLTDFDAIFENYGATTVCNIRVYANDAMEAGSNAMDRLNSDLSKKVVSVNQIVSRRR